jgi:hypothetical protein
MKIDFFNNRCCGKLFSATRFQCQRTPDSHTIDRFQMNLARLALIRVAVTATHMFFSWNVFTKRTNKVEHAKQELIADCHTSRHTLDRH